jgi:Gpi16 subunit, GPI transamidase component
MTYTPSQPHAKPALLQATLELPPHETPHLSLGVRKAFLRYKEHLPDAQRGWDLPPAVFVPVDAPHDCIYLSVVRRPRYARLWHAVQRNHYEQHAHCAYLWQFLQRADSWL